MLKFVKKLCRRGHNHKIVGWPYFFIMMFFVIFLMQLIMLLILVKQN